MKLSKILIGFTVRLLTNNYTTAQQADSGVKIIGAMFKIASTVDEATIHIVNLPQGTIVKSPNDAHLGQTNFSLTDEEVDILGFFSTDHKAVFTHHDTYLHMHLITSDRKKMGHLDYVFFKKGTIKLFLPAE